MCGIAGIHMKRPGSIDGHKLERFVNELFLGIEHRGKDASGIAAATVDGRVTMSKEPIPASDFIKGRPSLGMDQLRTAILHTRLATQGDPRDNGNNHPVLSGTTFVTHNGHISNDNELFNEWGLQRIAEVDSEAISAMIAHHGLDKVHLALQELQGGFAIAAIDPVQFPGTLVLAKGPSSPLIFFENNNFIVWASTLNAITEAWGNVFGTPPRTWKFSQLAEGQMLFIEEDKVEAFKFKVKPSYYASRWSGSGGSCGTTYSSNSSKDICACGHTRFWHLGDDYDEGCIARLETGGPVEDWSGRNRCDCREYALIDDAEWSSDDDGNAHIMCDWCGDWSLLSEMQTTPENYTICDNCIKYYGQGYNADESESDKVERGIFSDFPDEDMTPTLRLLEGGQKDPIYSNEEMARHHFCLQKVAEKTGLAPEFVEWVLFKADLDLVAGDAYLSEQREICDTAYADADDERIDWEEKQQEVGWFRNLLH